MRIALAASLSILLVLPFAVADATAQTRASDELRWEQSTTLRSGWYGGITGGWLMPEDTDGNGITVERDDGWGLFLNAGYRMPNNIRLEGELGYSTMDFSKARSGGGSVGLGGDVDMYSLTGAAYYDIPTGTMLTPFIGAGAGVVHQRLDRGAATVGGVTVAADDDSSTDFTAFAEAGVTVKLAQFELVPSYRYQWINDGEHGLDDTGMHVARLALHYGF